MHGHHINGLCGAVGKSLSLVMTLFHSFTAVTQPWKMQQDQHGRHGSAIIVMSPVLSHTWWSILTYTKMWMFHISGYWNASQLLGMIRPVTWYILCIVLSEGTDNGKHSTYTGCTSVELRRVAYQGGLWSTDEQCVQHVPIPEGW